MVNLCTGGTIYHRNHQDFSVEISRLTMRDSAQVYEQVGIILPGCSLSFEDGGCKITVENPCVHEWTPESLCSHCGQSRF